MLACHLATLHSTCPAVFTSASATLRCLYIYVCICICIQCLSIYSKLYIHIVNLAVIQISWSNEVDRDLLFIGLRFRGKKDFLLFSFSRSYSKISMNLRCRLLRGFKNIFLRIPKIKVKYFIDISSSSSQHELFSSYCPFNLVSSHSKFDI